MRLFRPAAGAAHPPLQLAIARDAQRRDSRLAAGGQDVAAAAAMSHLRRCQRAPTSAGELPAHPRIVYVDEIPHMLRQTGLFNHILTSLEGAGNLGVTP